MLSTFPDAVGVGTSWTVLCLIPAYLWQLLYPGANAGRVSIYIYHVVTLGSDGFGNLEPLIVVSGAGFPLIIHLLLLRFMV